jgi:hypothetical protein
VRLDGEVEHHLLAADADAVAWRELALAGDLGAVDEHAVAAPEILNGDAVATDPEDGVAARDQGIIERELAVGAPTDDELPDRELEIVG